jgi:2',3'-cyclic-nucleotide 2'-phosphodiesterase (5'-nucleotidase family)
VRLHTWLALGILSTACAGAKKDQGSTRASAVEVPAATPAPPQTDEPATTTPPPAPRPRGSRTIGECPDKSAVARFTVAHLNDMQARYSDRLAGKSRYAYIGGWLRQLKKQQPATIVLDAGDDYEKGAIAELRSMGETTRQMIQALPIDARTIGNHDFAYGEQAVLRDVMMSDHPVLAANVRRAGVADNEQPFERFVRFDVGCVRVGIVGLVTQNFGADDLPTKAPYDGVFEQDARYVQVLTREVAKHRSEVDVLVALTHLGLWDDSAIATVRGVDLVVGAHTEDLLSHPISVAHPDGSKTWVVQAGHFGKTLGRADLAFDPKDKKLSLEKYRIVEVDSSMPVDEDVAVLADRLEKETTPDAQNTIANAKSSIERKEMPSLMFRAAQDTWSADALVVGKDLFWEGLPKGAITLQRMYDSVLVQRQPAGTSGFSSIWIVEMSGVELAKYKARIRSGGMYEMFSPSRIDPKKTYKLAMDKRVYTYPRTIFGDTKIGEGVYAGEMIDALEAYGRARTAAGKTLD